MKRFLLFLLVIVSSTTVAFAQQATPTPASAPRPLPTPFISRTGTGMNTVNNPSPDGNVTMTPAQELALRQLLVQKYAQPLYRKPTASELAAIAPSPEILLQYKTFLERKNTGMFKLVANASCAENSKVVVATVECLNYTMPGSGTSYSFRTANYRISHLADLMLVGQNFRIPGIMMHGLMTRLGDVAIENISLRTPGIDFLTEFKPVSDLSRAKAIEDAVVTGLERDGFVYARSLAVTDNSTYALRVVAYDGKVLRAVPGASYNEMDFDLRRDVIVAFRVVARGPDGSVTVVWVELSNVDSPRLKIPEESSNVDSVRKKFSSVTDSGMENP